MALDVSDISPRVRYSVTTADDSFAIPFVFWDNADLKVYVGDDLQTITVHYSLTGAGAAPSGTLTLVTPAENTTITIIRDLPIELTTQFPLTGPFNMESLNTQLAKFSAMLQQVETRLARALVKPDADPDGGITLPDEASRASMFLAFDAAGLPIAAAGASTSLTPVSAYMETLLDDTTAAAARTTLGVVDVVGASDTVAGIVELATTAETETGTDATRAVTPAGIHDMTSLAGAAWFLDEDAMGSDSATKVASQQSIKAYVTTAVGTGPGRVKIIDNDWSTGTPASVTFEDADGMNWSTYSYFDIELSGYISASCRIICTMSQGGVYETGASDYHYANTGQSFTASFSNGTASIDIPNASNQIYKGGSQYNEMFHLKASLYPGLSDGTNIDGPYIHWSFVSSVVGTGNRAHANGTGALRNLVATEIDGIKFQLSTGTMNNGSFKVWGIK